MCLITHLRLPGGDLLQRERQLAFLFKERCESASRVSVSLIVSKNVYEIEVFESPLWSERC